jgi:hypothetical protein
MRLIALSELKKDGKARDWNFRISPVNATSTPRAANS